jgi:hypothetical protein
LLGRFGVRRPNKQRSLLFYKVKTLLAAAYL